MQVPDETQYIDALQDYIRKGESNQIDDDAESDTMSSVSTLNHRKKCPPYPAKRFDVGHVEHYNGKKYSVIKSVNGVIRWSGGQAVDT